MDFVVPLRQRQTQSDPVRPLKFLIFPRTVGEPFKHAERGHGKPKHEFEA